MKDQDGTEVPNPGSEEARAQGCTCPVLDNHHGKGFPWGGIEQAFWMNQNCPLHGGIRQDVDTTKTQE